MHSQKLPCFCRQVLYYSQSSLGEHSCKQTPVLTVASTKPGFNATLPLQLQTLSLLLKGVRLQELLLYVCLNIDKYFCFLPEG